MIGGVAMYAMAFEHAEQVSSISRQAICSYISSRGLVSMLAYACPAIAMKIRASNMTPFASIVFVSVNDLLHPLGHALDVIAAQAEWSTLSDHSDHLLELSNGADAITRGLQLSHDPGLGLGPDIVNGRQNLIRRLCRPHAHTQPSVWHPLIQSCPAQICSVYCGVLETTSPHALHK